MANINEMVEELKVLEPTLDLVSINDIKSDIESLGMEIEFIIQMAEFIGTSELIDESVGDAIWGLAHALQGAMAKYHDPVMKKIFTGALDQAE